MSVPFLPPLWRRVLDPEREKLLERRARQRQADARYSEKRKAKRKQPLVDNRPAGVVPGLSSRRVQELAEWYADQAYWKYSKSALAAGALDAELRAILRKEVLPEHVEIEFERVMKVVSPLSVGVPRLAALPRPA